ncbi:ABC transporter ATP-binding protein [Arsenicicoccus sp. oral taxon 190]|uniref:ABC transporter ATP-binding protein n=1 Tax=Arsenicicoccus sp. oral taxon 190 TaxID=1658671 RepID=UPI00067A2B5E|nr:ABC transporter ATP-binding protein [Arsenicicoccus sp. oral taxon 190]AKT51880.1 hypothetical protein ADJ73_12430 [Arsenicicoccus sp. oral taxon 190]
MTALEARSVCARAGGRLLLDGVDLRVEAGTVHALVGLNGAGKTTLMRLLLGMQTPASGQALVLGGRARRARPAVWRRVGHLVETPLCYPELTVRDNLLAVSRLRQLAPVEARRRVVAACEEVALTPWLDRRARTLSLGTRQKVGLAAALLHDPDVLVLDEPTNALDPVAVLRLRASLRRRADDGAAVLVSGHHLDELARIATVITVLHRGRVVGAIDPAVPDPGAAFFDAVLRAGRTTADAGGELGWPA